jgi:hypothetical protein
MPTRRQIATAEAGGKPLHPVQKMARLLMPVLEAELRGEHRWCALCLKLTPDRDLDKCARCNEVSYCRPLNRRQLEGGHYSAGMSAEEIERRQKEIADCQRLDWKAEHKHECAKFKAEAEAATEAETKAGAAGSWKKDTHVQTVLSALLALVAVGVTNGYVGTAGVVTILALVVISYVFVPKVKGCGRR